jgi:DNA repair protein RadC
MDTSLSDFTAGRPPEAQEISCRIHDMPQELRPREKLARLGPASLDNAELMALFISTGTQGRSAIAIGRELIARYGSMGALGGLTVAELAKTKGLGIAKASKLAAAFELGCRVAREQLREVSLETPELIHEFFGPQLRHLSQEQVVVAVLNARLFHVSSTVVSVGTVSESTAHPREILRPVISRGGFGFVVIHNHPSGDPSPSRADELVTRRLVEAAELMQLRFLDHVIIGKPAPGRSAFYSFRSAGVVP